MAEVGLVFDEVLDVARIVRGTGAEERKQHAARAQDPHYLCARALAASGAR